MLKKNVLMIMAMGMLGMCFSAQASERPVDTSSALPGGTIAARGESVQLYDGTFKVGDNFLDLVKGTDIEFPFKNRVTIVSIVPSIDTSVCELQTHQLDGSKAVLPDVDRVTISRDLPMAQVRFAKEGKIKRIQFVSDYKTGSFGKKSGLMMKGKELLARAVLVVDQKGVVRYLQVVPEISHLPDLTKAISVANQLVAKN